MSWRWRHRVGPSDWDDTKLTWSTRAAAPPAAARWETAAYDVLVRTISLTAKRRATLPAEVCEELGLEPGDKVGLERRLVDGEAVWILRAPGRDWSWFGAAK